MTTGHKPVFKYQHRGARWLFTLLVLAANFYVVAHTSYGAIFFQPLIDGLQFWAAALLSGLALGIAWPGHD